MEENHAMIRVLNPDTDRSLIATALSWVNDSPRWMREADAVWGTATVDEYVEMMRTDAQVDFGVFGGDDLCAVITIAQMSPKRFNVHVMCRRHAPVDLIVHAGKEILAEFCQLGLQETVAWPLGRNRAMCRILEAIGYARDGVVRFKGQSHGQLLEWTRYSWRAA